MAGAVVAGITVVGMEEDGVRLSASEYLGAGVARSPCCSLLPPAMLGSARQLGSLRSGLPISQTTDGGEGLRPPPSLQHKAEKRGESIPRVLPLPRLELTRTSRSKRTNLRRSQMETSKS